MQVVTLRQDITFESAVPVHANQPYVWPDGFATAFARQIPHLIVNRHALNGEYRRYRGQSLARKSLLLWRTGGYGDLLFLTPLIHELKRRWPSARITVACRPQYHLIFRNNPDVSAILPLPVAVSTLEDHDYHLHFEGTIETSTDPKTHAVDLFAQHAGVRLGNKQLRFILDSDARRIGREAITSLDPKGEHHHVAIQVRASSPVRTYPWTLLERVIRGLVERDCMVYLLGSPIERPQLTLPRVHNFCGVFPRMEQSVGLMAATDLLIAPDSSLTHFAGALDHPTIALYGPFPAAVRTKHYSRCIALEPRRHCQPCFTHGHQPCVEAQKLGQVDSPCFFHLPPERILAEVDAHFTRMEDRSCST